MSDYGISKYAPALAKDPAKVKKVVKFLEEEMRVPNECSLEDVTIDDLMENGLLGRPAARKLTEAWRNTKANEDKGRKGIVRGNVGGDAFFRDKIGTQNKGPVDNRKFENKYGGGHTETTYRGAVDKSQHNVTYGDHAQVGGTRSTTKVKLTDNAKIEAKQLNIGHGDQNITNSPETLSTDDHFFHDDPDYNFIDPRSVKVTPVRGEVYRNHLSQNDVYHIRPWKRNQALIINIINIPNRFRDGADKDSIRLRNLLDQLGFNVTVKENLSKADIDTCIDNFLSSNEIAIAPVVLLYIGSHGGRADITQKDSILPKTPEMDVTEMHETFKPQSLMDWFNRKSVSKDGEFGRSLPDMFVACATVPGSFALRDKQVGSWFVYAIALVFCKHAWSEPLRSLFTKVNEAILQRGEENNEPVNVAGEPFCTFGERSLYFYPHSESKTKEIRECRTL